ncbi:hypothetical protein AGLY_013817 [Aphis glycines]|uniref:Uncharacterized protein n=1 Tax=Aphis glycines TaxID=307491 RepID=A0A6G0T5T4_APHGL|nr:hypothetical protein AGLY_013817 [Aphis glycines]
MRDIEFRVTTNRLNLNVKLLSNVWIKLREISKTNVYTLVGIRHTHMKCKYVENAIGKFIKKKKKCFSYLKRSHLIKPTSQLISWVVKSKIISSFDEKYYHLPTKVLFFGVNSNLLFSSFIYLSNIIVSELKAETLQLDSDNIPAGRAYRYYLSISFTFGQHTIQLNSDNIPESAFRYYLSISFAFGQQDVGLDMRSYVPKMFKIQLATYKNATVTYLGYHLYSYINIDDKHIAIKTLKFQLDQNHYFNIAGPILTCFIFCQGTTPRCSFSSGLAYTSLANSSSDISASSFDFTTA